jgi:hypothetical protein
MNSEDTQAPHPPGPGGELEGQARALAEEHGLDPDRVLGVVRRGTDLIERHGDGMDQSILTLLREVMRSLPPQRVLETFEREDLVGLLKRHGYPAHLADADTPFYTTLELAGMVGEFHALLRQHQTILLEEGSSPVEFTRSRWLHRALSRLYYLRVPSAVTPPGDSEPGRPGFDIWQHRVALGERAHDRDTGRLKLDRDDATRLVKGRGKILDVKLGVLALLEDALRRGSHDGLWSGCLDLMTITLTGEEVDFYLRMDRCYRGEDAAKQGLWQEPSPILSAAAPGGLSDTLEIIGYCECELRFGVMDKTKREVLALADQYGQSQWRNVLGRTYFDVLGHPWRTQLDEILDCHLERRATVTLFGFWGEFRTRVNDAFAKAFDRDLVYRAEIKPELRERFEPHLRHYAHMAQQQLEETGVLPELEFTVQPAAAEIPANEFRRVGQMWRLSFGGEEPFFLPDSRGLHLINYLIRHRGHEIPTRVLDALVGSRKSRRATTTLKVRSESHLVESGLEVWGLGNAGPHITEEGLARYRTQLAGKREQLAKAEENNDEARTGPLRRDIEAIEDEIRRALGLGGRMRMASDAGEQVRKAVGNAIRRALREIRQEHEALWKHLDDYLDTGDYCGYDPGERITWIT